MEAPWKLQAISLTIISTKSHKNRKSRRDSMAWKQDDGDILTHDHPPSLPICFAFTKGSTSYSYDNCEESSSSPFPAQQTPRHENSQTLRACIHPPLLRIDVETH